MPQVSEGPWPEVEGFLAKLVFNFDNNDLAQAREEILEFWVKVSEWVKKWRQYKKNKLLILLSCFAHPPNLRKRFLEGRIFTYIPP